VYKTFRLLDSRAHDIAAVPEEFATPQSRLCWLAIAADQASSLHASNLCVPLQEFPLKASPLHLKADWHYERSGERQHYVVQAWVKNRLGGRAHGWFQPGSQFVLEKIEITRPHRSKGYGTVVLEELRAKARQCGCSELVFQGVRADNSGAIKLYKSLGASPVPTSGNLCDFVIPLL
jgi:GNAT superfamily N-acetyltransferase